MHFEVQSAEYSHYFLDSEKDVRFGGRTTLDCRKGLPYSNAGLRLLD